MQKCKLKFSFEIRRILCSILLFLRMRHENSQFSKKYLTRLSENCDMTFSYYDMYNLNNKVFWVKFLKCNNNNLVHPIYICKLYTFLLLKFQNNTIASIIFLRNYFNNHILSATLQKYLLSKLTTFTPFVLNRKKTILSLFN